MSAGINGAAHALDPESAAAIVLRETKADIALAERPIPQLLALKAGASRLAIPVRQGFIDRSTVIDELLEQAESTGLLARTSEDAVIRAIADALDNPEEPPPAVLMPREYGPVLTAPAVDFGIQHVPLSIAEWQARKLDQPDPLMGDWLTTTSRVLLIAGTGLGKTNFAMAIGMAAASGQGFLHWRGRRPAKVLYIDGEMSRRLLRQRIADAVERLGEVPAGFFAFSHEDVEAFAPLNTPAGRACVEALIQRIGGVDLVIFDSIMCLTTGDMKDEESWQQTLPWARSLTRRGIGQIWVHHTGHDETRGYGTKTREWQMDTVVVLEAVRRDDTDVSFCLDFRKARERSPATRLDFQQARVALLDDRWMFEAAEARRPAKVSPLGGKFLDALRNAMAGDERVNLRGQPAVSTDVWRAECVTLGLIDPGAKAHSARTLFAKHRRELVSANLVACEGDLTWPL